jgi:hypothetical protein
MKFDVPKNLPDLILYIWKIINIQNIMLDDLLFKISFEMLLLPPKEAEETILNAIEAGVVHKDEKNIIRLSENLEKKLNLWQKQRRTLITKNLENQKKGEKLKKEFSKNVSSKFNILLKAFLDKGTLNRAVTVSDEAIKILNFDPDKGHLKTEVKGSKEDSYLIEISINEQNLYHNCHDFETKRARNKKFCKHLVKLFLYLKKQDEKTTTSFLQAISKDINDWNFNF